MSNKRPSLDSVRLPDTIATLPAVYGRGNDAHDPGRVQRTQKPAYGFETNGTPITTSGPLVSFRWVAPETVNPEALATAIRFDLSEPEVGESVPTSIRPAGPHHE